MPSLKDLKNRIASVKSTQKITKAMQMVAAAKLRRAQEAAVAARPYAERMTQVLASLGAAYAAGLATRFWDPGSPSYLFEDLYANWQVDKTWYPSIDAETRTRLYQGWLKAVERAFNWVE